MTTVMAAPQAPNPYRNPKGARLPGWLWLLLFIGASLVIGNVVQAVVDQVHRNQELRPLEAAALASQRAHKPIAVVSQRTSERWGESTESSPKEALVRELIKPGNAYLEPVYLALEPSEGGLERPHGRCYYFATQRQDGTFNTKTITGLLELCYAGKNPIEPSYGWFSLNR